MNILIEWKDIEGYEGIYQVSNTGLVRSKDRFINTIDGKSYWKAGKLLKPKNHKYGYHEVLLCKNGIKEHHYVHRLLASAFIPNPDKKPQVNHLNGLKYDNRIENLEWVTQSENALHACRAGLYFDIAAQKHRGRRVLDTSTREQYSSIDKAAKAAGLSPSTMRRMLVGQRRNTTSFSLIPD